MRHTIYTTQVFSLFGGVYLPEYRDPDALPKPERNGPGGKWPAIICGLLLGATTAAGAFTATRHIIARPILSQQNHQPLILLKLPTGFGVDEAIY